MSIKPELVERDEDGYWVHSQFPQTELGNEIDDWVSKNQLELKLVFMESDIDEDDHPAYDRYFHAGDPDFHDWEPSEPIGQGWFIGGIYETEDGPVCVWLRPISEKLKKWFFDAHRKAEEAAYDYFCACDVGEERIQASEIYERIRTATRTGG
ncbi:hypothetical protein [Providencia rustigianii]|uniref:hypothetical protein n=1 Tax=Providencia rustigianii TaxID=158850 RepID=UPI00223F74BA|nr:hypothetical protein [Providencia rustigianii]